ncbi:MAG: toxin co-regulated pilus biosynthesis Q family protein [Alphaproteobacteria bacterium]|nr:toxin co-regulated pilus biosynthesis Q family protein [Alphaproteobacteria bacterium]
MKLKHLKENLLKNKCLILFGTVCLFGTSGCVNEHYYDDGIGVSGGAASSAPAFATPAMGGTLGENAPNSVDQRQYGRRGEDVSANRPSHTGDNGLYSFDSETDNGSLQKQVEQASTEEPAEVADNEYDAQDPVDDWLAPEGSTVRQLLLQWGDKAGWRVVWESDREYILEAGAMFRGRFMDVSSALLRSFARTRPAPWGTFYKGNRVLLITTTEDENAD